MASHLFFWWNRDRFAAGNHNRGNLRRRASHAEEIYIVTSVISKRNRPKTVKSKTGVRLNTMKFTGTVSSRLKKNTTNPKIVQPTAFDLLNSKIQGPNGNYNLINIHQQTRISHTNSSRKKWTRRLIRSRLSILYRYYINIIHWFFVSLTCFMTNSTISKIVSQFNVISANQPYDCAYRTKKKI